MSYVYIVNCSDDTLYTGWTVDLKRRLSAHNSKKGARYTRSRTPVRLVYFEEYEDKIRSMQREYEIKHLSRAEKLLLIKEFDSGRLAEFSD